MKSRFISSQLLTKSRSKFGRILVLTGARQTGKTTLARLCFPDFKYLSIEDPVLRGEYTNLTADQWRNYYPWAILDEVQKAPLLVESIKSVYDQFNDPQYIMLGSSQILLLGKVKESLAGRCSIFEIYPLTIPEMLSEKWEDPVEKSFLQKTITGESLQFEYPSFRFDARFSNVMYWYSHYLQFGGYPAIIEPEINDEDKHEWLNNYIRTYLERDVRDLADFRILEPFIKIQRITSLLTGQLISYSQLAKEAGVSAHTAGRYISYLGMSYQAFLLEPWFKNQLKRLSKTPKLHYMDPGIQRSILGKRGGMTGYEYESAVVAEIYKQMKNIAFRGNLFHLRTLDGREIDLLIETEAGYMAIEIKQTENCNQTDAKNFRGLAEILDKPLINSFIISNDLTVKFFPGNVVAMPAALFLT